MLFATERLICRRWTPQDLGALHRVYSDAETVRWCGDGIPLSVAACQEWYDVTQRNYAQRGYGMFALEEVGASRVIGFGGLVHPGDQEEAEIKYAFERSCWGRGYASEIAPALLEHGAKAHGLKRIVATVAAENRASQRVLIKSGMTLESTREEDDGSVTQIYGWPAEDRRA